LFFGLTVYDTPLYDTPLYYLFYQSIISPMELCVETWKLDPLWGFIALMDHCIAKDSHSPEVQFTTLFIHCYF
jgi:hypothetical protein